jgi:hypothetical protein
MQRKILSTTMLSTGHGTHSYDIKYQGDWGDWALINCMDIGLYTPTEEEHEKYNKDCCMNYGGFIEKVYTEEGITRAKVDVYYD